MDFERLEVWQKARVLTVQVYQELAGCRDYGFKDQITRSALSVPSNIAEGMERGSDKEKCHFSANCQRLLWRAAHTDTNWR